MKKITYFLLLFLSVVLTAQSQVLVGTGTNTGQRLPFDAYYGYSYTQSIYLASELNATGTITSLQWYYTGTGAMPNSQGLVVYIGHTTKTAFSSGTDWEPVTNLTQVYAGGITTDSSPGWKTITLTTPFVYNGTSNLIVAVDENLANWDLSSDRFWNTAVSGNRSIAYIADGTNPDPAAPPAATFGFPTAFIPNTVFGGITQACPTPIFVTSSNVTATSATITWQAPTTPPSGGSDYYISTSNVDPTIATIPTGSVTSGNTFNATALLPATNYYVWVRDNCGSGVYSSWSGVSTFLTACVDVPSFNQNFDANTNFPVCWSKVGPGGYAYVQSQTSAPSSPNVLYMVSYSTTSQAVVSMPPVSNAGAGTHRLKFNARAAYTAGGVIEVGYLTNVTDASTFVSLQSFATTSTTVYDTFIAELGTDPGLNQYLAFRHSGAPSNDVYIDNIVWETTPTCPDVSGLVSSNATISSVDIAWTAGGTETAWQYVIGATTVTDPNTLTPVGVITNPTATIPGLNPQTSYKVWVRSNCGASDFGAWVGPITITTPCLPIAALPWSENFDSLATGTNIFPSCWAYTNTLSTWSISTFPVAHSGANSLRRTWSTDGWAFTPTATLTAGTSYTLSYFMRTNDAIVGYDITVAVGGGQSEGDMSEIISSVTGYQGPSWNKFTYEFTPTVTGVYSFGLHVSGPNPPNGINFDDFNLDVTPNCIVPTELASSSPTTVSATVSWTESISTPANGYEYYISTSSTVPTAATVATGSVAAGISTVNILALTPATTYYVWVRSVCTATDKSAWSDSFAMFNTLCLPFSGFTENFDTTATGAIPFCWSKIVESTNIYAVVDVKNWGSASAPNSLELYNSGDATATLMLVTPTLANLPSDTYRMKFKASGGTGYTLSVGTMADPTDSSTYTEIQVINLTSSYVEYIIPFNTSTTDSFIAFKHGGGGTYRTISVDDIVWEPTPTAVPSCATGIVATPNATCGNFATQLAWTAAVGADGYYLTVGTTAGGNDLMDNEDIGNVTSYSLTGNFNTTYFYKLTPYNAFGNAVGCTEQSFATFVTGCYCTSVPTSNDGLGITNVLINTTNFPNGDVTYANYTATNIDLPQALTANVQISFATGYTYDTNIWIDYNNNLTFETDEIVYTGMSLSNNPTVLDASFTVSATAALGTHRMRLVTYDYSPTPSDPCYSGSYGVTIDFNVTITAPPTCLPITGLTVDSYTSSTASISWTAPSPAPANGYDYYVSTTNTAPIATTTPTASVAAGVTTASLSALTPATTYYVWVRSVCSLTDLSPWSSAVTFTTACVSTAAPYSQNFETATVPGMPLCSSIENAGTGNNWNTINNPGYGFTSKTLRYAYNSSNAANAWFYTQPVTLVGGTSYDISYKYGNNSTFYTEKLKVTYGTIASAASMTNVLADHPSITGGTFSGAATQNTVTFTPTVSGDYYFGFNAYSIADQDQLYVDDILVQATLATNTFDSNGFTYYPNPVKDVLNLTYSQDITNVAVFNILGQQVITKSVNANQSKIDMSNLSRGTYLVKITADNQVKTIKVIKE